MLFSDASGTAAVQSSKSGKKFSTTAAEFIARMWAPKEQSVNGGRAMGSEGRNCRFLLT